MVFDGDFHSRIDGPAADGMAHLDCIFPAGLEASRQAAIIGCALIAADDGRSKSFCHTNRQCEVLFRRTKSRIEALCRRADASCPCLNLDAEVVCIPSVLF